MTNLLNLCERHDCQSQRLEIEQLRAALEEARGCHDQPCSCGACFAISNALNRPSHEPEKSP
jgi:hypothetical protein